MALENGVARIVEGKMSDKQRQWFIRSAKENYDNAISVASKYPQAAGSKTDDTEDEDTKFLKNL